LELPLLAWLLWIWIDHTRKRPEDPIS
jgi:hypothetical protein